MTKLATHPPINDLYETDFHAWTQEQARLLRERRWDDLDLENLIDEVGRRGVFGEAGDSEPDDEPARTPSQVEVPARPPWTKLGRDDRGAARPTRRHRQDKPELGGYLHAQVEQRYLSGRLLAAKETGIAFGLFPEACPFSPQQALDPDFLPEDRNME